MADALPPGVAGIEPEHAGDAYTLRVAFDDGSSATLGAWPMMCQAQAALPHVVRQIAAAIRRENRKRQACLQAERTGGNRD